MNKWDEFYLAFWSWWRYTTINRLYWKFAHRFIRKHQYNRLDTKLPPGYYDLDAQILYSVMNNFKSFYERETSTLNRNTDWDKLIAESEEAEWHKAHYDGKRELDAIYDWWVYRYLKTHDDHEIYWQNKTKQEELPDVNGLTTLNQRMGLFNAQYKTHQEMAELEDQLENEADEMLARLMKYRQWLWD